MQPFEVIEHTADVGIIAYGRSLEELFANAAAGMMSLLIAWLNELLVLLNADGFVPGRFTVRELTDTHLRADVTGEPVDPTRHHFHLDVKAATYHTLEVKQDGLWQARVIFDV